MSFEEEFRARTRATWAAGDWDSCAPLIEAVGALILARVGVERGTRLLDVGTGSGTNVAIPAALRGAEVTGADVTPELLELAIGHANEAGVTIEWIEADAQELPFEDAAFDRVISTFGAMFAPDHKRAAAELVRVCAPGGVIGMTTWLNDGFAGELFKLSGAFLPPPPPGVEPPPLWGMEEHVKEVFGAAGVDATITHEFVELDFSSVEEAVRHYSEDFGPFLMARKVLEPEGRWEEFLDAFGDLIRRFDVGGAGGVRIRSGYFVITAERSA